MAASTVDLGSKRNNYIINSTSVAIMILVVYLIFGADIFDFSMKNFYSGLLTKVCIFIVLAVSLNLTTGCLGEIVLGHAAFMAVGAYTAAIFLKASGLDGVIGFTSSAVLAFISAGIAGILIGIPVLRLKGDYLAIITLGFNQIIISLVQLFDFTGGPAGIKSIPRNLTLTLAVIVTCLIIAILFTFMRSKYGRNIIAIREDEVAAESSGIPVTRYKIATFALSAALAGIGGAMYVQYLGTCTPLSFDFTVSVNILVFVVLGGLGSFTGSITAATILTILPELLRGFAKYRLVVYSAALILIMLTKPSGLLGRYEFSLTEVIMHPKKTLRSIGLFFKKIPQNIWKGIKTFPKRFLLLFSKGGR